MRFLWTFVSALLVLRVAAAADAVKEPQRLRGKAEDAVKAGTYNSFSGDSSMMLFGGKAVAMQDVKVGDDVRCYRPSTLELGWCQVAAFAHAASSRLTGLVRLSLESGGSVSATPEHFLWALRSRNAEPVSSENKLSFAAELPFGELVHAAGIRVGDMVVSAIADVLSLRVVTAVSQVRGMGAYAPVLANGGLPVVDSAVASSFAGTADPTEAYEHFMRQWQATAGDGEDWGVAAGMLEANAAKLYPDGKHVATA